jgi:hypothetical protein
MNPTGREAGDDVSAADAQEPMAATADGTGESATQSTDPVLPKTRDPRLPRRVPKPSQLRGQEAITPAHPAEQTLQHLRDVLDRLP